MVTVTILGNSLIAGSMYALVGVGMALTYAVCRFLNFSHGQMLALGGYLFYTFYSLANLSFWISILGTIICGFFIGAISYHLFIHPFLRKNPLLPFISTLALALLIEATISLIFGVNVRSVRSVWGATSLGSSALLLTPIQLTIIISTLIILSSIGYILHLSFLGKKILATASNSEALSSIGTDPRQISLLCCTLSTILAFIAGIAFAFDNNIAPNIGNSITIKAFASMVLGGLGSIWGAVIGAYILAFIENFAISFSLFGYSLPASFRDAISFVIILMILFLKPHGLMNKSERRI